MRSRQLYPFGSMPDRFGSMTGAVSAGAALR
jgi:hypothetical protein